MKHIRRWALIGMGVLVIAFVLIQFVPYGRVHANTPVVQEPAWDSAQTRELAVRACFDCHSNQTNWIPWYTNIAPMSWLVQHDVDDGRRRLNFSEWNQRQRGIRDAAQTVADGSMPRWFYVPLHPEANLSASEKAQLIKGLQAIGSSAPGSGREGSGGD
jgi:cytochrome c551/c552